MHRHVHITCVSMLTKISHRRWNCYRVLVIYAGHFSHARTQYTHLTSSGEDRKAIPRVDTGQCSPSWDRTWSTGIGLILLMKSFSTLCRANTLLAKTAPAPEHKKGENTTISPKTVQMLGWCNLVFEV